MLVTNLEAELKKHLPKATKVSIAVALAKKETLERIFKIIPLECKIKIVVGIDLPTSPEALNFLRLKMLENSNLEALLYYQNSGFYHPKVYIINKDSDTIAYVGSSNFTDGGLNQNIEVTFKISEKLRCIEIHDWFKIIFQNAFPITCENIRIYQDNCDSTIFVKPFKKKYVFSKTLINKRESLEGIDFSTRFFKKHHHEAFRNDLWFDNSPKANKEREKTKDQFIELHKLIFDRFGEYGLEDLQHNLKNHLVSLDHQINPENPTRLNSMWLSYGKSQTEIKKYREMVDTQQKKYQTFIHHARLQIRIELKNIGIWILFGKEGGSTFDRDYFRKKMKQEEYQNKFFSMITNLPERYWIKINEQKRFCYTFINPPQLHAFCKQDSIDTYFSIGCNYNIEDDEMSIKNLPKITLKEFQRQFPIYDLMRHKL